MEDPFSLQADLGSHTNLKERIFQQIQSAGVNDRIFESVKIVYDEALEKENVVLSRTERKRLLAQVLKLVLEDMRNKLDGSSNSA